MGVATASITANVERVRERIAQAAARAGRRAEEVTLVAVAKTFPAEKIREAYAAGLRDFGENRVQEWEAKQPLLRDLDATWHMVGHLQGNKAARAARLFHTIDSLDSLALAQKLNRATAELGACPGASSAAAVGTRASRRLPVLLEVCLAPEEAKSGVGEAELPALAEGVLALPHLDLRGLMCIPPYFDDPERARPFFRRLRAVRDALRQRLASRCHPESRHRREEGSQRLHNAGAFLPELSMGMSHDFEVAIEEGATQVRLGTAIFGPRPGP